MRSITSFDIQFSGRFNLDINPKLAALVDIIAESLTHSKSLKKLRQVRVNSIVTSS